MENKNEQIDVLLKDLDFNVVDSRNGFIKNLNKLFGIEFKDITPQEIIDDDCCLLLNGYDQESKKMIRINIENNIDEI